VASSETDGLLQTLLAQVNNFAGTMATKDDIESIRDTVQSGLVKVHQRIDTLTENCGARLVHCQGQRDEAFREASRQVGAYRDSQQDLDSRVSVLQKKANTETTREELDRERRKNFKYKVLLALVVFVLSILACVLGGYLQKNGIAFVGKQ